jgi:molybdopterin converting factor small subunit
MPSEAAPQCTVRIASPLRSYTHDAASVRASGSTVADVLADLDQRYKGLRFRVIDEQQRIRPHIRIFVRMREVRELSESVGADDEVHLICALSGG